MILIIHLVGGALEVASVRWNVTNAVVLSGGVGGGRLVRGLIDGVVVRLWIGLSVVCRVECGSPGTRLCARANRSVTIFLDGCKETSGSSSHLCRLLFALKIFGCSVDTLILVTRKMEPANRTR